MTGKDIIKLGYQIPMQFSWNFMENHYDPKIPDHVQQELCEYNVTPEEFKKLIITGHLRKETDTQIIIVDLQLIQKDIMPDSLEDIVNRSIEEGLSDEYCNLIVSECIVNEDNIIESTFEDEDVTYKSIALYLMDFMVTEKIHYFSITINPKERGKE